MEEPPDGSPSHQTVSSGLTLRKAPPAQHTTDVPHRLYKVSLVLKKKLSKAVSGGDPSSSPSIPGEEDRDQHSREKDSGLPQSPRGQENDGASGGLTRAGSLGQPSESSSLRDRRSPKSSELSNIPEVHRAVYAQVFSPTRRSWSHVEFGRVNGGDTGATRSPRDGNGQDVGDAAGSPTDRYWPCAKDSSVGTDAPNLHSWQNAGDGAVSKASKEGITEGGEGGIATGSPTVTGSPPRDSWQKDSRAMAAGYSQGKCLQIDSNPSIIRSPTRIHCKREGHTAESGSPQESRWQREGNGTATATQNISSWQRGNIGVVNKSPKHSSSQKEDGTLVTESLPKGTWHNKPNSIVTRSPPRSTWHNKPNSIVTASPQGSPGYNKPSITAIESPPKSPWHNKPSSTVNESLPKSTWHNKPSSTVTESPPGIQWHNKPSSMLTESPPAMPGYNKPTITVIASPPKSPWHNKPSSTVTESLPKSTWHNKHNSTVTESPPGSQWHNKPKNMVTKSSPKSPWLNEPSSMLTESLPESPGHKKPSSTVTESLPKRPVYNEPSSTVTESPPESPEHKINSITVTELAPKKTWPSKSSCTGTDSPPGSPWHNKPKNTVTKSSLKSPGPNEPSSRLTESPPGSPWHNKPSSTVTESLPKSTWHNKHSSTVTESPPGSQWHNKPSSTVTESLPKRPLYNEPSSTVTESPPENPEHKINSITVTELAPKSTSPSESSSTETESPAESPLENESRSSRAESPQKSTRQGEFVSTGTEFRPEKQWHIITSSRRTESPTKGIQADAASSRITKSPSTSESQNAARRLITKLSPTSHNQNEPGSAVIEMSPKTTSQNETRVTVAELSPKTTSQNETSVTVTKLLPKTTSENETSVTVTKLSPKTDSKNETCGTVTELSPKPTSQNETSMTATKLSPKTDSQNETSGTATKLSPKTDSKHKTSVIVTKLSSKTDSKNETCGTVTELSPKPTSQNETSVTATKLSPKTDSQNETSGTATKLSPKTDSQNETSTTATKLSPKTDSQNETSTTVTKLSPKTDSKHKTSVTVTELSPKTTNQNETSRTATELSPKTDSQNETSTTVTKLSPKTDSTHKTSVTVTESSPKTDSKNENCGTVTELAPKTTNQNETSGTATKLSPKTDNRNETSATVTELSPKSTSQNETSTTVTTLSPKIDSKNETSATVTELSSKTTSQNETSGGVTKLSPKTDNTHKTSVTVTELSPKMDSKNETCGTVTELSPKTTSQNESSGKITESSPQTSNQNAASITVTEQPEKGFYQIHRTRTVTESPPKSTADNENNSTMPTLPMRNHCLNEGGIPTTTPPIERDWQDPRDPTATILPRINLTQNPDFAMIAVTPAQILTDTIGDPCTAHAQGNNHRQHSGDDTRTMFQRETHFENAGDGSATELPTPPGKSPVGEEEVIIIFSEQIPTENLKTEEETLVPAGNGHGSEEGPAMSSNDREPSASVMTHLPPAEGVREPHVIPEDEPDVAVDMEVWVDTLRNLETPDIMKYQKVARQPRTSAMSIYATLPPIEEDGSSSISLAPFPGFAVTEQRWTPNMDEEEEDDDDEEENEEEEMEDFKPSRVLGTDIVSTQEDKEPPTTGEKPKFAYLWDNIPNRCMDMEKSSPMEMMRRHMEEDKTQTSSSAGYRASLDLRQSSSIGTLLFSERLEKRDSSPAEKPYSRLDSLLFGSYKLQTDRASFSTGEKEGALKKGLTSQQAPEEPSSGEMRMFSAGEKEGALKKGTLPLIPEVPSSGEKYTSGAMETDGALKNELTLQPVPEVPNSTGTHTPGTVETEDALKNGFTSPLVPAELSSDRGLQTLLGSTSDTPASLPLLLPPAVHDAAPSHSPLDLHRPPMTVTTPNHLPPLPLDLHRTLISDTTPSHLPPLPLDLQRPPSTDQSRSRTSPFSTDTLQKEVPALTPLRAFPDSWLHEERERGKLNPRPGKMILFTEPGFHGEQYEIWGDVADATALELPSAISVRVIRGGWVMYEKLRYQGRKIVLEEGDNELSDPWGAEDEDPKEAALKPVRIGSLRHVVRDYAVPAISLFMEENGEGKRMKFLDSTQDARIYGQPVKTASIIVHSGLWVVYREPFFEGRPCILEPGGYPNLKAWGGEEPKICSLQPIQIGCPTVEKPYEPKIILFESAHFEGRSWEINRDIHDLKREDDTESPPLSTVGSLRVLGGCWVGYEKEGFRGHQYLLEEGEYRDWKDWGGAGEELTSIRLIRTDFSDPALILYAESDFEEGPSLELCEELPDVELARYGTTTQSILVHSGVWVAYENVDFSGAQYILEKGTYHCCQDWGASNCQITSIQPVLQVGGPSLHFESKIQLFSEPGFQGDYLLYEDEKGTFPESFNPRSCRVHGGSWILYGDLEFSGEQYVLSEGEYPTHTAMGCLSDTVLRSFMQVPIHFSEPSISLHGLECFEGKEIELTSEVRSLQAEGFNNHVLSVRVKGGIWVLYEHSDFRGRQWLLDCTEIDNWLKYSGLQRIGSLCPIRQRRIYFHVRNRALGQFLCLKEDAEDMKAARVLVSEPSDEAQLVWYYEDGRIKNQIAPNMSLQVIGSSNKGTKVVLWSQTRMPQQTWRIDSNGHICSQMFEGMILDVKGGQAYDRDHVILWDEAEERPTQMWTIAVL